MLSLREYRNKADRLADFLPWAALVAPALVAAVGASPPAALDSKRVLVAWTATAMRRSIEHGIDKATRLNVVPTISAEHMQTVMELMTKLNIVFGRYV